MSDAVDDAGNVAGADRGVEPGPPAVAADWAPQPAAGLDPAAGWEPTGAEAVDQLLANLGSLDGLAPADQAPRYDEAHRRLHDILTGADELAGADDLDDHAADSGG